MVKRKDYKRNFKIEPLRPLKKTDVDDALLAIWEEYEHRKTGKWTEAQPYGLAKNEAAKNFVRREIYALGLSLLAKPPAWDIVEIAQAVRLKTITRPDALERIFHALFLSLYESDEAISRKERWMMAKDLEYAHRHKIEPQLLCGFLYQSGGREGLLEKLEDGYIEPEFRTTHDND